MAEREIRDLVDNIIAKLDSDEFEGEAVNWADLRCVEARRYAGRYPAWCVTVAEADPASSLLCREIEKRLYQQHKIRADVHTEW